MAVGVNADGRREVLGMTVGHSEAEPFWTDFLRSLARRGLRGVKLVVSDAHEGLKAAIAKALGATWQRCRVHFMRNAMAYAGKTQRRIVSAWVGTAFAQDDAAAARKQRREVAGQARPRMPSPPGDPSAKQPAAEPPEGWPSAWTTLGPMCWPAWASLASTGSSCTAQTPSNA